MIDGKQLGQAGFKYLGVPYSKMDCQAFVEQCLRDCGMNKDLAGSNAWYREVMNHGWVGTPEECVKTFGTVPDGSFLFILKNDGGEPAKYKPDGIGNASHIGIVTGTGEGAIHSSSSRGCVSESKFQNKTIPNGGWNRVGLYVDYVLYEELRDADPRDDPTDPDPDPVPTWHPTLRRGAKGTEVAYLQSILMDLGYDLEPFGADGDFGRKTEEAVRQFQRDRGLVPVDGVVGIMTWNALEQATPVPGGSYSVLIHGLDLSQAKALQNNYPGAEIIEEGSVG